MFSILGDNALKCAKTSLQMIQDESIRRGKPISEDNLLVIGFFLECIFQKLSENGILGKYIISTDASKRLDHRDTVVVAELLVNCLDDLVKTHAILMRISDYLIDNKIPGIPEDTYQFVECVYHQIVTNKSVITQCLASTLDLRDRLIVEESISKRQLFIKMMAHFTTEVFHGLVQPTVSKCVNWFAGAGLSTLLTVKGVWDMLEKARFEVSPRVEEVASSPRSYEGSVAWVIDQMERLNSGRET